jgi:hypothetical protein
VRPTAVPPINNPAERAQLVLNMMECHAQVLITLLNQSYIILYFFFAATSADRAHFFFKKKQGILHMRPRLIPPNADLSIRIVEFF